jgi:hypothetical protein
MYFWKPSDGFLVSLSKSTLGKAVKAAGNAYPRELIVATLQPILEALANSKVDLASWPPSDILCTEIPEGLEQFTKALMAKGRVIDKKAFKLALEKARLAEKKKKQKQKEKKRRRLS